MIKRAVDRDERTIAVENASYRFGYLFLSFAILLSVAYRGIRLGQSSWDLFAIVIVSGLATTVYQSHQRILTTRWARTVLVCVALALVTAALLMFTRR